MASGSLAARIAQEFANSAPEFPDPEEELDIGAPLTSGAVQEDGDNQLPPNLSNLRKKTSHLLADEDAKYAGKTVSRKSLLDEWSDDSDLKSKSVKSDQEESDLNLEFFTPGKDNGVDEDSASSYEGLGSGSDDSHEAEDDDGSDDSPASDDDDDHLYDMDLSNFAAKSSGTGATGSDGDVTDDDDTEGVTNIKQQAVDDVSRGQAVQKQIRIWESLLEIRIELQKLINASNQLPQFDLWPQLTESSDSQHISHSSLQEVEETCAELVSGLLQLQDTLDGSSRSENSLKRSCEGVEDEIGKRFKRSQPLRNDIIQKWDDKTRLNITSSHRKSHDGPQATLTQIDQILLDRDRLTQRTRIRRNALCIIGKSSTNQPGSDQPGNDQPGSTPSDSAPADKHLQDGTSAADGKSTNNLDAEIFNDDDFYQQLLRELIEQQASKSGDPIAMSRKWLEFQALRKRIRRTVDTRASKGRKLRYNVMPKLVNFMAPFTPHQDWDEDRKDELFSSVFGQKPQYDVKKVESSDVVIFR